MKASERKKIVAKLESNCQPEPNSGCWLWLRPSNNKRDDYGWVRIGEKTMTASRAALIIKTKKDRKGLFCLHTCDNKACINPDHLRWGSAKENMRDAYSSWRGRKKKSPNSVWNIKPREGQDMAFYEAAKAVGGYTRLAEALNIPAVVVLSWNRVPYKLVREVHRVTGVPLYKLAPELFDPKDEPAS